MNTDHVYDIMVIVTMGIFGLVTAVLVAALVLFRERRGETRVAPPVHGHHGLEIIWTAIPAVIVIALTGISWKALNDNESGKADMQITVWGQQFDWTYDYPREHLQQVHQLVVPVNAKIDFDVESKDVIHGWWVPAWRVQINATRPDDKLRVTPTKIGEFKVVCTFICGSGHPVMGTGVQGSIPRRSRSSRPTTTRSSWPTSRRRPRRPHRRRTRRRWRRSPVPAAAGAIRGPRRTRTARSGRRSTASRRIPTPRTSSGSRSRTRAPRSPRASPTRCRRNFKSKLSPDQIDTLVKAIAGGSQ